MPEKNEREYFGYTLEEYLALSEEERLTAQNKDMQKVNIQIALILGFQLLVLVAAIGFYIGIISP